MSFLINNLLSGGDYHKRFDSWIREDLKKKLRVCLVTFNVHINKKWNLLVMSFF